MSAINYKVSAMLSDERSHRGSGTAQPCDATLSVYPGFEHLTADVLAELDSTLPVGMENRQFLPEVFILDFMLAHPCRLAHESHISTHQVLGSSVVPHFYVIPVLWRAISYLPSCTNSSAKGVCERMRVARRLVKSVVAGPLYRYDAEHHILLHTSTAARTVLWGWKPLADALSDPRVVSLVYEGIGGDTRMHAYRSGPRSVPVPYFVEPHEAISQELQRWTAVELFQEARKRAGDGARVFMRCSAGKGGASRKAISRAFVGSAEADVKTTHGVTRFDRMEPARMVATFLATGAAMRNSTFCLVPEGLTATTRRLYEALQAGCIPVLLSAHSSLPFEMSGTVNWSSAILNASMSSLRSLPTRLASISDAQVQTLRAAGSILSSQLSYTDGGDAARLTWGEIVRLGRDVAPTDSPLLPPELLAAVSIRNLLVLTVCSGTRASAYRVHQKRKTSAADCLRWLHSLRRHYDGPVAIAIGDTPGARLQQAADNDAADGTGAKKRRTWLLSQLEVRIAKHPLTATRIAASLQGNQLRCLWYATILAEIQHSAPSASVLSIDARDVVFQADPITALQAASAAHCSNRNRQSLVLLSDCKCSARRDSYFRLWGNRCLHPPLLEAIGDEPPANGGVVFGTVGALRMLYAKAVVLAATPMDGNQYTVAPCKNSGCKYPPRTEPRCMAGGREQHLLTGAAYALAALHPHDVCQLPNGVTEQVAALNLGVNNNISLLRCNERLGRIEAPNGRSIAIIHQYDRRPNIKACILKLLPPVG